MTEKEEDMEGFEPLSLVQLDALREISSIGAGNATTALAQFIAKKIEMSTPEVLVVGPTRFEGLVNLASNNMTMVILGIEGPIDGHIMLLSDYTNSQYLIDVLMGREPEATSPAMTEIDISSLKEVSSVMSGSFLRVISETLNTIMKMTPPDFVAGRPDVILDLIRKHCLWEAEPTICLKSALWVIVEHKRILLSLLFIPSASSLAPLIRFLGM